MPKYIIDDHSEDGVDRRGFLRCMAWAGTGMLWTMSSGILSSTALGKVTSLSAAVARSDLFFIQVSDSHIGFDKKANANVTATLQAAIDRINALPEQPEFLIHTGDITQLSKDDEFDTARQVISSARTRSGRVFYVPGEHDVIGDNGALFLKRYGKGATGGGWYSMDHSGVHFIGLVNVLDLKPGGLGRLGPEQLKWLHDDVKHLSSSTPIVVFAHVPLWSVYPEWGWGTDDSAQALGYLTRFGSVTVLNGHIHQVVQKVEGHMTFHTALSTAFPQPMPGTAPAPGPMTVPADQLRHFLGLTSVTYVEGGHSLAVVDAALVGAAATAQMWRAAAPKGENGGATAGAAAANEIRVANFSFAPSELQVPAGTTVTWVNGDDVPHEIVSVDKRFAPSPVLDTGVKFSATFADRGRYPYFCAIHPKMTGVVVVS